jgi:raffinose/stachyose/melibiose transport system permease protein
MKKGRKAKHAKLLTAVLSIISVIWIMPILIVLQNSFKKKTSISREPFQLASTIGSEGQNAFNRLLFTSRKSFVGLENYVNGIQKTGFFKAFADSLFITVFSVFLIILCTSMCGWYLSRVKNKITKTIYYFCVFSMIIPFQMVMFTLSKMADILHLGNPIGIIFVYLGFGAGLAVFMFCGFVKGIPLEIEEAAMIDGCNPLQTFFGVVLPILKPTCITVAILQTMWIWNDYLLPYLVLNIKKYKTIPIAIQYLKGGYGSIDMGAMMAMLVLAVIPIIVFYIACQKYIIEGVVAGAVKG